jgi:hypothetical protein
MVVFTARIPMHRQPKFRKNAGNFGNLATANDINVLSVADSCPGMGTLATAREHYENRLPKLPRVAKLWQLATR